MMAREASQSGHARYLGPVRKFLLCLCPALLAGAALTFVLYRNGTTNLIPGVWLLLYGCAVLSASTVTIARTMKLICIMGALFMGLGILAFACSADHSHRDPRHGLRRPAYRLRRAHRTGQPWRISPASPNASIRWKVLRQKPNRSPSRCTRAARSGEDGGFDRLIYERVRLGIMSALATNEELTFNELKALFDVSDGNLGAHARKLEEAGYVAVHQVVRGAPAEIPVSDNPCRPKGIAALSGTHRGGDQGDAAQLSCGSFSVPFS